MGGMVNADEIKELRQRLGLTQTEFANLIGTTYKQVGRWERGEHKPIKMAVIAMQSLSDPRHRFGEDEPAYDAG